MGMNDLSGVIQRDLAAHRSHAVRWRRGSAVIVPATLFSVLFAARYGYSPLVVAMHLAQVTLGTLVLFAVAGVLARRCAPSIARIAITLLGGVALFFYLLVITLSTFTNEAWGWSVSLDLARAVAPHMPAIVGNLPVWRGWIVVGIVAFDLVFLLLVWRLWRASQRIVDGLLAAQVDRFRLCAWLLVLTATVLTFRTYPASAAEPFTALLSAPGQVNLGEARAINLSARQAYAGTQDFPHRNVILILSEALRADHLGIYGYARPTTPFLSSLPGVRRVDLAMATCPFTACGVVSILASRDSGVFERGSLKLQDVLHDRGYRVNVITSGDNTVWGSLRLHYGESVDYFFDGFHSRRYALTDDRGILEGMEAVQHSTGRPAFFYFFLSSTHTTGTKLPAFRKWTPVEIGVGPDVTTPQRNAYDNGVLQADNTIREIFAALDAKGYLANSIIMILGDHGEGLGEHGFFGHTKYVYQEALHIPLLIIDDPAAAYANLAFATQSDVAPTILDRLGLPAPTEWQGQSLFSRSAKTFSTHWTERGRPWHAVVYREGGKIYKYMYVVRWGTRSEELYELTSDPGETSNLISRTGLGRVRDVMRARADARWANDVQ
ncbi:MAG: hypothetical protein JWM95_5367 [Gemmatimonadetes bacterium]|nr:hypothetical protein [Gemmatimonadota bacterium]